MSVTSGFFDSDSENPRLYTAEEFSSIFDGLISDGVYQWYGNKFEVTPISGSFKVNVGTGRAWFNHTWTLNDSLYTVPQDPDAYPLPHTAYDRNDVIAIKVDKDNRQNSIVLCKGLEDGSKATNVPADTAMVFYYPIANILVPKNAANSTKYTITSLIDVDGSKTKYVYAVLANALDISEHLNTYRQTVLNAVDQLTTDVAAWEASIESIISEEDTPGIISRLNNQGTRLETVEGLTDTINNTTIPGIQTNVGTLLGFFNDKFFYAGSGTNIDRPPYTICRFGSSATGTKPNLGTGWILVITGMLDNTQTANVQLAMSPTSNKIALRRKKDASSWYQWRYIEFTT